GPPLAPWGPLRVVSLHRHGVLGFGFVAGSERPVVVRAVTAGGPSDGKLFPGDRIVEVNGHAVGRAPRGAVVHLVRSCRDRMELGLAPMDTSAKSAFLRPSTRERLRNNPARVRFAERGPAGGDAAPQQQEHHLLFMPKVLKVYLENGQTKSFKFDSSTTVRDVVRWLQEKLRIEHGEHFALLLERVTTTATTTTNATTATTNATTATTNATTTNAATATTAAISAVPALTLLPEGETLDKVVRRPDARSLRCRFRVAFYPLNAYEFLCRDPVAFEYFYLQCCNDVVRERWAGELSRETLLLLAALHMQQQQQHAACSSSSSSSSSSSRSSSKYTVKHIVREWGMETFVPPSLLRSSKDRELRKTLNHHLKMHQSVAPTSSGRWSPTAARITPLRPPAQPHYLPPTHPATHHPPPTTTTAPPPTPPPTTATTATSGESAVYAQVEELTDSTTTTTTAPPPTTPPPPPHDDGDIVTSVAGGYGGYGWQPSSRPPQPRRPPPDDAGGGGGGPPMAVRWPPLRTATEVAKEATEVGGYGLGNSTDTNGSSSSGSGSSGDADDPLGARGRRSTESGARGEGRRRRQSTETRSGPRGEGRNRRSTEGSRAAVDGDDVIDLTLLPPPGEVVVGHGGDSDEVDVSDEDDAPAAAPCSTRALMAPPPPGFGDGGAGGSSNGEFP
ncbi:unnamed protein product, partial [Lampetra planeri]